MLVHDASGDRVDARFERWVDCVDSLRGRGVDGEGEEGCCSDCGCESESEHGGTIPQILNREIRVGGL